MRWVILSIYFIGIIVLGYLVKSQGFLDGSATKEWIGNTIFIVVLAGTTPLFFVLKRHKSRQN